MSWQPIETAPTKEGCWADIWCEQGGRFPGCKYLRGRWVHVSGWGQRYSVESPTHWMPIPAAPFEKEVD